MKVFPFMNESRRAIRYAYALGAYADEWANAIDSYEGDAELPSLSGCEIMDVIPANKMPRGYLEFAEKTIRKVEAANGRGIVELAYTVTGTPANECVVSSDLDKFGHYLYMQSVGHGVGLWDHFEDCAEGVKVPITCGPLLVDEENIESFV